MRTAFFLIIMALCALAATAVAAAGGEPAILGALLAGAFIGLAGAAASAAVDVNAPGNLTEPREKRGPTAPSPLIDEPLSRRVFGKLWFGALGAFAVLAFVPLISLARKPGRRVRTGWRPGVRLVNEQNAPIPVDHLVEGGFETVFPENGVDIPEAAAMLIRMAPTLLPNVPSRANWTPQGYIAFSKVCTHAGCPVALYRHASHQLYCPCHQSMFDVLNSAKPIAGPAPRALPQLGLDVDPQGYLIARSDFSGPVGPDDWDRVAS